MPGPINRVAMLMYKASLAAPKPFVGDLEEVRLTLEAYRLGELRDPPYNGVEAALVTVLNQNIRDRHKYKRAMRN